MVKVVQIVNTTSNISLYLFEKLFLKINILSKYKNLNNSETILENFGLHKYTF